MEKFNNVVFYCLKYLLTFQATDLEKNQLLLSDDYLVELEVKIKGLKVQTSEKLGELDELTPEDVYMVISNSLQRIEKEFWSTEKQSQTQW